MTAIDFDSPPDQIIDYFKSKKPELHFDYDEIAHSSHHKAFTVAKVTKLDLLSDIHESLTKAIKEGQDFKTWKANLEPTLKQYGWFGKTEVMNPGTGEFKKITVGSRRLKTIYDTNMRTSYAQGRYYSQMQSSAPYLRYSAILDFRVRPEHRLLHGIILPKDDPWWDTNYPPNGWNCRCRAMTVFEDDLTNRGWNISKTNSLPNIADKDWAYHVGKTDNTLRAYENKLNALKQNCNDGINAKSNRPCAKKLYEVAKKETILDKTKFKKWFKMPKDNLAIANIPSQVKKILKTKSDTALLSVETLKKNKDHHPEIEWYEYLLLNSIVERSIIGVKDGDSTLVVVKSFCDDSAFYYAVLKVTENKKEIYITSFRKTKKENIERKIKNGDILWDKR
ncbi:hypothetical protein, putative prophage F protein [Sulfurovum sp. enrichment culture clone C5]|uniref:Phage head morphogenesis domain-containing protein n=1 Tax=Sulfurovum sp. enrichment culture clone C5 TaxID=497650 RepID=A0A0S4XLN1_9BACT|nr:hypothetical protein, putative prophage F protein [Sulfurovum sp. enrichment culture clone C5]